MSKLKANCNCINDKCGGEGIVRDKDCRLISIVLYVYNRYSFFLNIISYILSFQDALMSKITSASQLEDESGESPIVDFSKIYMDEVGGVKKACIYGLGSQAVF